MTLVLNIDQQFFALLKVRKIEVESFINSINPNYDNKIVTEVKYNKTFLKLKNIIVIILKKILMHLTAK